jgi:hypothetical protein
MTSKTDDEDDDPMPMLDTDSTDDESDDDTDNDDQTHDKDEIKQQRRQILSLKRQLAKSLRDNELKQKRMAALEDNIEQGWNELQSVRTQLAMQTTTTDSKRKHLTAPDPDQVVAVTVALIDERDISLIKYRLMANLFRNMPRVEEIQAYRKKLNDQIKAKLNIHLCPPDTPGVWVSPNDAVRLMMTDHKSESTGPYQVLLALDGAKLSRSSNHVTSSSWFR